jgi:hypothetical protein
LTGTEATGTEVDITKAIRNFATNSGANNSAGTGTGAANLDLSTGEDSIIGDLAIAFIDAYDGTNTAPTVLQYADAGVTGVTVNNLAAVNAAVANQTAGTTALIQALADTAITAASVAIAASDAVLAQIGTEANDPGTSSAVTVAQINTISPAITGAIDGNLAAYQAYINANTGSMTNPATVGEVQAMVNTVSTTVAFNAISSNGTEAAGTQNLAVGLSAASGQDVTVDYTVTGTATGSGVDYTLADGSATITAGSTSTNIVLVIAEDALDETNETVIVT